MTARRLGLLIGLALVLTFPYLPFVPFSVLGNVNDASQYAMVAISLVVLVGWVGQISLGHAGLVGTGAYVTGMATGALHVGFPVSLLWGAAAGMLIASLLGVVALRVRGLYLAVATLIFSWVAQEFLFRQEWFTRHSSVTVAAVGKPDTIPYFDWSDRKVYFYGAWAAVAVAIFLMANLRDSKSGRAFFAVRGSEVAAASLGIDVMRTKLVAFAISGCLAGAAGALIIVGKQTVTPDAFKVDQSLFFLSIAVVGGLSSLGGSVAAALLFAFLNEAFFRVAALGGYLPLVSALLLAAVLLLYRGGLAAIPVALGPRVEPLRDRAAPFVERLDELLRAWSRRGGELVRKAFASGSTGDEVVIQRESRLLGIIARATGGRIRAPRRVVRTEAPLVLGIHAPVESDAAAGSNGRAHGEESEGLAAAPAPFVVVPRTTVLPGDRAQRRVLLATEGVTVRFGGLTANEDVSLKVCEGEIVGLIGPNGAGKTTCFNAIAGLNQPAAGRIEMFGQDVTDLPVHQRALLGVGRTFQAIQLFGQLSVFENLLVATHQQNATGLVAHLCVTPQSLAAERAARSHVNQVIDLLGLGDVADRLARDLPFGVLRMVEVARALVARSRLIMLDEPASGLDNSETDRLADLVRFIRSLGVTILLIEHDVRMVTSVSDYLYVLEQGRILAEGTPADVTRDERVVAAYLGRAEAAGDRETAGVNE